MKIKTDIARELTWSEEQDGFKVVLNDIKDSTRWSIIYDLVIEKDGKYYKTQYSVGATESQDEQPFDNEGDEVEFKEVDKIEETCVVYK